MKALILVLVSLVAVTFTAFSDEVFGTPAALDFNTDFREGSASLSSDGLSLYFHSDRPGGQGNFDLWMVNRSSVTAPWSEPLNLGASVNTNTGEYNPCISFDGLSLYFSSNRPGGIGMDDLWVSTRATVRSEWGTATNLGGMVNSRWSEVAPSISKDGLQLLFSDYDGMTPREGGQGGSDLWIATRPSRTATWGRPVNPGQPINSGADESNPRLSPDGLMLFFKTYRATGQGWDDIWVTTRPNLGGNWSEPNNLGPVINSTFDEKDLCISQDGNMLYVSSYRPGGKGKGDLWQIPILSREGFAALVGQP